MICFIDLRGQTCNDDDLPKEEQHPLFAFYDTVTSTFLRFSGEDNWSDRKSFIEAFRDGPNVYADQEDRFTVKLPDWVPEK